MLQADKFSSMPNHSMQQKLENLTKNRLKRSSFIHYSKILRRQYRDKLPVTTPLTSATRQTPWDALPVNLQINTSVPQLLYKDQQSDIVKKALTMALIAESFPEESWIHVYTDGSATNAETDGGAGIYAKFPDQPTEAMCLATGKFCSNYKAEVEALSKAAEVVCIS